MDFAHVCAYILIEAKRINFQTALAEVEQLICIKVAFCSANCGQLT